MGPLPLMRVPLTAASCNLPGTVALDGVAWALSGVMATPVGADGTEVCADEPLLPPHPVKANELNKRAKTTDRHALNIFIYLVPPCLFFSLCYYFIRRIRTSISGLPLSKLTSRAGSVSP
jgi:hypothetical protein